MIYLFVYITYVKFAAEPNLHILTQRKWCWVCRAEPCAVEVVDVTPGGELGNHIKHIDAVGKGAE